MQIDNRSPEAAELLQLGRHLAYFHDGGPHSDPALETLAFVFRRLADIGDIELLGNAVSLYSELRAERDDLREQQYQAERQRYAEQLRQHELAVTVECPYCGAAPGDVCRTASPTGLRHSKGSGDHKDRLRAARKLLPTSDEGHRP